MLANDPEGAEADNIGTDIENVIGGDRSRRHHRQRLVVNRLDGGPGGDTLNGASGNDTFVGATGRRATDVTTATSAPTRATFAGCAARESPSLLDGAR